MADIFIHDIQGTGQTSPLVGQSVTKVPGVVTAVRNNGFYLQDPNPDGNEATSEGIFVFTGSRPSVSVGNSVLVSGTVSEFIPGGADTGNLSTTQITSPTIETTSNLNSISPTIIGTGGRTPPTQVIDNDNFSTFDPAQDGIDFYESLEGMLVQVNNAVAVSPTNNFGEIFVLPDNGANATGRTSRGGIVISPDDFNPERIQIDDTLIPNEPQVNVGDNLGTVTGVLDYNFGNFEILNTSALSATSANLTRETTSLTSSANQLTVASFNVLNLDPSDTAQINALASQIANNLKSPDILGLQEIQDNNGATNDSVVDASETFNALINAIAAAGGPTYEFRQINPVDDTNGGEPGGNIRVGFLFNPNRVDFIDRVNPDANLSTTSTTVQDTASGADLSLSPGLIQPTNPAFEDSRKPLAGEFLFNGNEVFVIANHFTSKGGSTPLFGQVQPPINGGEEQREAQAQIVNNFVDDLLAADPNANIVVLGDLNEFQFEEPLQILEGDELNNLTETLPANERYSYIFEGNSQALDRILVSDRLLQNAEYDPVHVNAEFIDQASDHDPVLSRLTLNLPSGVTNGTPGADSLCGGNAEDTIYGRGGNDRLSGGSGGDRLFGLAGDDNLTGDNGNDLLNGGAGNDKLLGGRGSDRFVLAAGNGTDTISDFKDGDDSIELSSLTFEQLTIAQGTGANSNDTLISLTSSDLILAILSGVQSSAITAADFVV